MTVPNRGFKEDEFAARTAAAQAKMAEAGMAGLLLTTEPEVRYFSGFHTLFWQSPTRPWFLFVPAEGKPVAIIPEIGAELMRRTWIEAAVLRRAKYTPAAAGRPALSTPSHPIS